jgi:hypothetical protein
VRPGNGYAAVMARREDLEQLSSKELHDRAMKLARHRLDLGFLWTVAKTIPAAEAAAGEIDEAEAHVAVGNFIGLIEDFFQADEGDLADALRPLYLEYIAKHGGAEQ